jgi:hypothetical protein
MQIKTYTDLKALIQALAGVSSFTTEEDSKILSFVNRRAAEAYNLSPSWARYLVESEERTVSSFLVSGYTTEEYNGLFYKYGDDSNGNAVYIKTQKLSSGVRSGTAYVFDATAKTWSFLGGSYSRNVETGIVTFTGATTINIQRDTSVEYENPWDVVWAQSSGGLPQVTRVQAVAYTELVPGYTSSDAVVDRETIGEFIRIHRKKAFLNESALEYDFFVNNDGANVLNVANGEDGVVYVTYKKPFTEFTTSSTDIPQEFFYFIAHAAYADFLRMDGQHGKALTEEQLAQNFLDIELEKIDIRNNNNSINKKFSTYVNRQSR